MLAPIPADKEDLILFLGILFAVGIPVALIAWLSRR